RIWCHQFAPSKWCRLSARILSPGPASPGDSGSRFIARTKNVFQTRKKSSPGSPISDDRHPGRMPGMGLLQRLPPLQTHPWAGRHRAVETAAAVEIEQGSLRRLLLDDFHKLFFKASAKNAPAFPQLPQRRRRRSITKRCGNRNPKNADTRFRLIPDAHSISISLDRVSVPMEEPRRPPAGRPRKDAPKRGVERNFRMAYCGTVRLHDENGVGGYTIRYGCMPDGDVIGLRDRMVADAATLRSQR